MLSSLRTALRTGPAGVAFVTVTLAVVVATVAGFFDLASLIVTVGGTIAVTCVTFPGSRLRQTWQLVGDALLPPAGNEDVLASVQHLARAHRVEGAPGLERALTRETDPFLRAAVLHGLDTTSAEELEDALVAEARMRAADGEAARQVLLTVAKLFPAFGLIGTLIGLALLLRNLGHASVVAIGPGLGVAVLTTLYGAVLSNVVVLPLATKLQAHLGRQAMRTEMIIDGALLVQRKEYPTRIEHVLRAYLGPRRLAEPRPSPLVLSTRAA